MNRTSRQTRPAFTLVELITVIGIIAILIALLIPIVSNAQRAAKSVACQSNLRQIFAAAMQRSISHAGFVQPAGSINRTSTVTPQTLEDPTQSRYAWYTDDDGEQRPAPLQAAVAPYLGQRNLRTDSTQHMVDDLNNGIVKRIFHCPADEQFLPALMIASLSADWNGPLLPTSYAVNEGVFGFEANYPRRLRGNLAKVHPASEIVFMGDGLPREGATPFIAWYPTSIGKSTLWDAYTHAPDATGNRAGYPTEFDFTRHPRFRMNVVFCDGHVDALAITQRDLPRGVLLAE